MRYPIESSLVHKTSAEQLMLVSADSTTKGTLSLHVGLPNGHPSLNAIPAKSMLLSVELMRQCAIAFAHLAGGVPQGWAFLMNQLTFTWDNGSVPTTPEQFLGRVDVRLRAVKMRREQVSDLQLEADFIADGEILGHGCGDLSCLPPRAYQAIRRNAPPVANTSTGALGTILTDTRLNPGTLESLLVWNREDQLIFDHPSDHLSGMLLASALLEAHLVLTGAQAVDFGLWCENFAEYDAPVQVSSTIKGPGQTQTLITQSGRTIASGSCGGRRTEDAMPRATGPFHRELTPAI
jgi:hypothetical protein